MKIKVNKISYHVEMHQQDESKPNLILLHGFMGSGAIFDNLIDKLRSFCNPITVDLLGHGKTSSASSPKRFQAKKQVDDLALIIQKVAKNSPYLYGYSMGGRLALQFALAKPSRLKGLILESANPGLNSREELLQRKKLDKKRTSAIENNFSTFLEEWKNLPLFKTGTTDEDRLKHYYVIQRKQNPKQMAYSIRGFGTGAMPAVQFDEIEIPALLLAGEKDEKYVDIATEIHQQNSKSVLKIIPKAGHRVHVDNPAALVNYIKDFFIKTAANE